jgi:hypothetical protein
MLITRLNLEKPSSNYGWAGGFFWHVKETMVASGRFTVHGSGDGLATYAYNGVTAALPALSQGSGGAFDCWKTPKFTDMTNLIAGATNTSSWIVMNEVGTPRQYLFAVTDQNTSSWNGYGRFAYNAGGGATPTFVGASVSATLIPGLATNEQWFFGSSRASPSGVTVRMLAGDSGYINCFCDDTAENGVTSFGWTASNSARGLTGFVVCPMVGGPSWDLDPVIFYTGSNIGIGIFTWNQLGYGPQSWVGASVNTRSLYTGAGSTRVTDGTSAIRQIGIHCGTAANAYFKGFTGRSVGYAVSRWTYPMVVQDNGTPSTRWVPGPNGPMVRWPEDSLIVPR